MEHAGPQREQFGWRERLTGFLGRTAVSISESLGYMYAPGPVYEAQQTRLAHEAEIAAGIREITNYLADQ